VISNYDGGLKRKGNDHCFVRCFTARNKNETAKRKSKSQREAASTKKEIVLELLRRKEGATITEIAKVTNWQSHSIRGFISLLFPRKWAWPSSRPRTRRRREPIESLCKKAATETPPGNGRLFFFSIAQSFRVTWSLSPGCLVQILRDDF
jgi:Protein of unknown function (DUF3489)